MKRIGTTLLTSLLAVLLLGGGTAFYFFHQARAKGAFSRSVARLLTALESDRIEKVEDAVVRLVDNGEFMRRPDLVLQIADHFSSSPYEIDARNVELHRRLWRTLLRSRVSGVEDLISEPLSQIRHQGLLLTSRSGPLTVSASAEESDPQTKMEKFLSEDLAKDFFLPPVATKGMNHAVLWDRMNLEELGNRIDEASQSLVYLVFDDRAKATAFNDCLMKSGADNEVFARCLLEGEGLDPFDSDEALHRRLTGYVKEAMAPDLGYGKVNSHWELNDRDTYLVYLGDLLGRFHWKSQRTPGGRNRLGTEALVDGVLSGVPQERCDLVHGISLYQMGEAQKAIEMLNTFVTESVRGDVSDIKPVFLQMAEYYLALAHFQMARDIAGGLSTNISSRGQNPLGETRLELRLARYYATLGFEREYREVVREYFSPTGKERQLVEALAAIVWGPAEDKEGAEAARRVIRDILKGDLGIPHPDDRPWWEAVAEGRAMNSGDPPESSVYTLFRVARIYEEKGDLYRLEKTIDRMNPLIEGGDQQCYRIFLQALLDTNLNKVSEASEGLARLLANGTLPKDIDLELFSWLVREVGKMKQAHERMRQHLAEAERIFRDSYVRCDGIHPGGILAAGVSLLRLQLEAPLLYPGPLLETSDTHQELLKGVLAEFSSRRLSYFLERVWLELRDSAIRYFYGSFNRGDYETALEHVEMVGLIERDREGPQLMELKGMVYQAWAERLLDRAQSPEDLNLVQEYQITAATFYQKAYERLPSNSSLRRQTALAYAKAGDPIGVLRVTDSATIPTEDGELRLAMARAKARTGDYQGAIDILEGVTQLLQAEVAPVKEPFSPVALGRRFRRHSASRLSEGPEEEAYLWYAFAKIKQARLPLLKTTEALNFVHDQLQPSGDKEARKSLMELLTDTVINAYQDPDRRKLLKSRFERVLVNLIGRLSREKKSRWAGRKQETEEVPEELAAIHRALQGLDDVDGVLQLLNHPDRRLQDALQEAYVRSIEERINEEGSASVREIEDIKRKLLDAEARKLLLLVSENHGYEGEFWQGSMFLRGYQLYLQALEEGERQAKNPTTDANRVASSRQFALEGEARAILSRIVRSTSTLSSSRWTPRACWFLGQLWDRAEEWEEAHNAYDALIKAKLAAVERDLDATEREEIHYLVRLAFLRRADASYKANQVLRALQEYEAAATVFLDSPQVLWAQYQLGNCYLKLDGRRQEGLQEFEKGKSLISRFFSRSDPGGPPHWLTGDRLGLRARRMLKTLLVDPDIHGVEVTPDLKHVTASPGDVSFWRRLFDTKIEALSNHTQRSDV